VASFEAITESLTNPNALSLPAVRGLIARIAGAASALTGSYTHQLVALCFAMLCSWDGRATDMVMGINSFGMGAAIAAIGCWRRIVIVRLYHVLVINERCDIGCVWTFSLPTRVPVLSCAMCHCMLGTSVAIDANTPIGDAVAKLESVADKLCGPSPAAATPAAAAPVATPTPTPAPAKTTPTPVTATVAATPAPAKTTPTPAPVTATATTPAKTATPATAAVTTPAVAAVTPAKTTPAAVSHHVTFSSTSSIYHLMTPSLWIGYTCCRNNNRRSTSQGCYTCSSSYHTS
jgi:hypothetical protein